MWSFVPVVSLLIGAIFGSCEMDNGPSYMAQPGDESNDNRGGRTFMNVLEAWKEKEPLMMGEMYEKQIDPNRDATDGRRRNEYLDATENTEYDRRINSLANIVSKRREIVESWFDLDRENEELQDPLPLSQKKKKKKEKTMPNPWIYRLENRKRESVYGASSDIRRPIRVPFNSWGGKRGKEYPRAEAILFPAKRTKSTAYNRYDQDAAIDGYDVKRKATDMDKIRWKTPFNSWGGKRAEKLADRGRYRTEREDAPILGVIKGYGFIKGGNDENNDDEIQNDNFLYRIPFRVYNKMNEHDSSMIDQSAERLPLNADKRVEHHQTCKRTNFNPWGGKRSLETCNVRFGKNVALLAYSSPGNNKILLCCYPVQQPK